MKSVIRISILFAFVVLVVRCEEEEVTGRDYPKLSTIEVTNITSEGVTFNAEMPFRGDFEIKSYGFVWNKFSEPTLENSDKIEVEENIMEDVFSLSASTALQSNSIYFVRAFVQTAEFTIYGQSIEFFSLGGKRQKILDVFPLEVFYTDTINIVGENFSSVSQNNVVTLGRLHTTAIFSSDTLIKIVFADEIQTPKFPLQVSVVGNVEVFSDSLSFIGPNITSLSKTGAVYGDTLDIVGSHFGYVASLNTLKINDLELNALETDSTRIKFVLPVISEPFEISITNSLGQEATNNQLDLLEPTIVELSPAEGFYGDEIVVKGKNFSHLQSIASVFFNDQEATISSFTNDSIVVTMPTGLSNPIQVQVAINEIETEPKSFYYLGPSVESFEPSQGTWRDLVTLRGTNFSTTSSENLVHASGVPCEVVSSTSEELVVRVPDEIDVRTFSFDIEVNDVQTTTTEVFEMEGLMINSVNPAVATNIGDEVVISGSNFHPFAQNNSVTLNGQSLEVLSASSTEIVVKVVASLLENSLLTAFFDELAVSNTIDNVSTAAFAFNYSTAWTTVSNFNWSNVRGVFTVGQHGYVVLSNRRLYEYDFVQNTWTQRKSFPGDGGVDGNRYGGKGFSVGGRGYYGLGFVKCIHESNPNIVCSDPKSDLWKYTPQSDSWTRLNDPPVSFRTAQVVNEKAYVMSINETQRATFQYNPTNDSWISRATITESDDLRSWTLKSFSSNGELFCVYQNSDLEFEFYKYSETEDTWTLAHKETLLDYIESIRGVNDKVYMITPSFETNPATGILFEFEIANFVFTEIATPSEYIFKLPFSFGDDLYLRGNNSNDLLYKFDVDFD